MTIALTNFEVVRQNGESEAFGNPTVHCRTGKQLVITIIARDALADYFRVPGDQRRTLTQWNLVVRQNMDAFARIISQKYANDEWTVRNEYGQSYPQISVVLEDIERCGERLTDEALKRDAG